jgi:enoyl-CoA hydratase
MQSFAEAVQWAHEEPDLRALIVTGADGAFCAGGDLYQLDGFLHYQDGVRLSAIMTDALTQLRELPVPTLAAMEGAAMGGGAELALACDVRVMAEDAILGLMHVRLGIAPAWGGGQRLLYLVGYARALEWLATGRELNAEEALEYGLANHLAPSGQALPEAMALARAFAEQDPQAVRAIKSFLRAGLRLPAAEAAQVEQKTFPALWAAEAHIKASKRFVARRNRRTRPA